MKQIQNKRFEQNISCHFKKYERLNYDNENMEYSFGCALFLLSCFVSVFFSASVYASVLFDAIVNWIAYTSVCTKHRLFWFTEFERSNVRSSTLFRTDNRKKWSFLNMMKWFLYHFNGISLNEFFLSVQCFSFVELFGVPKQWRQSHSLNCLLFVVSLSRWNLSFLLYFSITFDRCSFYSLYGVIDRWRLFNREATKIYNHDFHTISVLRLCLCSCANLLSNQILFLSKWTTLRTFIAWKIRYLLMGSIFIFFGLLQ